MGLGEDVAALVPTLVMDGLVVAAWWGIVGHYDERGRGCGRWGWSMSRAGRGVSTTPRGVYEALRAPGVRHPRAGYRGR